MTNLEPSNNRSNKWVHGTKGIAQAASIFKEGFKVDFFDKDGERYLYNSGNLGMGTYITKDWRVGVFFGDILIEARLKEGTRIIDVSLAPDKKTIAYLRKEFGNEMLRGGEIRKTLPRNKRLKERELVELLRYHYNGAWEKTFKSPYPNRKSIVNFQRHRAGIKECVRYLKIYGFHGFGNPNDENGMLIFSPDRVIPERIKAVLSRDTFFWERDLEDFKGIKTLKDLQAMYLDNPYVKECLDKLNQTYPNIPVEIRRES